MTSDRHDYLQELFLSARELEPAAREEYLSALSEEDRREVESLLSFDETQTEGPPVEGPLPPTYDEGRAPILSRVFDWIGEEEEEIPEQLGPYRIISVIGKGGMGVVYHAEQDKPRRDVALKVVRQGSLSSSTLSRFEFEVSVLGRLEDPGIARIYDAGMAQLPGGVARGGMTPYFAMELIRGDSLIDHAKNRQASVEDRLKAFVKVCRAVHHAHQKGIIHRDLKPSNILVDPSGQPKILDFGIAKSLDSDLQLSQHTAVGMIVGTLRYMSPEQTTGEPGDTDTRSDVYALGVILFELLSGSLPYDLGTDALSAQRAIRETEPDRLGQRDRRFRGDLETITSKALEKEKTRRYASASDLADDIECYLDSRPIRARPPSASYQALKFARRNRVLVGGLASTFFALILGLILTWINLNRAKDAEARALTVQALSEVDGLEAQLDELWPCYPHMTSPMEEWIAQASTIREELPSIREHRDNLRAQDIRSKREDWLLDQLTRLIERIEAMDQDGGALTQVSQRLERAQGIVQNTIDDYQDSWDEAIEAIEGSELYGELELEEEIGLIPLEEDPESGLWEFWVWESGERPERDESGSWIIEESTGIVLVLIPGGTFSMGAQADDPDGTNYDVYHDDESTVTEPIEVSPFFLSKYEMTQAQWSRLMGENPSQLAKPLCPVNNVSWTEVIDAMARLSLTLPTSAQWEYAARAKTLGTWWFGNDPSLIGEVGNIADSKHGEAGFPNVEASIDDGFSMTSPVGTYRANPFGLYDTVGNVFEWCLDVEEVIQLEEEEALHADGRIVRGGCYTSLCFDTTSSWEMVASGQGPRTGVGFRPCRLLPTNLD